MTKTITRPEVEDFLFHEAELLDTWQLNEWSELFTPDATYLVPAMDEPEGAPEDTLYLIYDDRFRLGERAKRLLKKQAHAEHPRSVLRRVISNVRIRARQRDLDVACNFVLYRSRGETIDVFPGHSEYALAVTEDGAFRIRTKRAFLDSDTLRTQGKISIIL